jgi:hypothetical protein
MQICNEITESERGAVVRHLTTSTQQLPLELLNKMILRYETKVRNMSQDNQTLKFELDDRELAIKLYFDGKLTESQLKELINYE